MSSELATVDFETGLPDTDASSLGVWGGYDDKNRPVVVSNAGRNWSSSGRVLIIAVPAATAVPDFWFWERWKRVASTAPWVSEGMIGRSISRSDALRVARQIIERAEQERIQFAEWESERGILWEEGE